MMEILFQEMDVILRAISKKVTIAQVVVLNLRIFVLRFVAMESTFYLMNAMMEISIMEMVAIPTVK